MTAESCNFESTQNQVAQIILFPSNEEREDILTADEHEYAAEKARTLGSLVLSFEPEETLHDRKFKKNEEILGAQLPPEARHSKQWFDLSLR